MTFDELCKLCVTTRYEKLINPVDCQIAYAQLVEKQKHIVGDLLGNGDWCELLLNSNGRNEFCLWNGLKNRSDMFDKITISFYKGDK